MDIKIITDNFNKKMFNNVAKHPLQSWEWGDARKEMEIEVLRIGEFIKDNLQNVYQLTFHKLPLNYKIGYLPRSVLPSKEILSFLTNYCKKNKTIFIKIEPYFLKETLNIKRLATNLVESTHPLFPSWTQILDLAKSEAELLKNMKPKTRYNIKLAQKKGVEIKEMSNNEGFKIFSKLYFETCMRQKYYGHNLKYHQIVWENLKNNIAYILIAFYNKIPLAAYELFYFNGTIYYPYGGSSLEYRNIMSANLLMWEAIRLGKKLGGKKFDMWGSLPPNYSINNSWAGFTKFKEGYGTNFTEMIGSYDLVINIFYYTLYKVADKIRDVYLKLKKVLI